jgi:hypothetical protein
MSSDRPLIHEVNLVGHKGREAGSFDLAIQIGTKSFRLVLPPFSEEAINSVIIQLTTVFDAAIPEDLKLRNEEMGKTTAVLVMQLGPPWDQGLMEVMTLRQGAGYIKGLRLLAAKAKFSFAMQACRALAAIPVDQDEAVDLLHEASNEEMQSFWWQHLLDRQCDAGVLFDTALNGPETLRHIAREEIERRNATGFGPERGDSPLIAIATASSSTGLAACIDRYSGSRTFSRRALDQAIACNPHDRIKAAAWALARLTQDSSPKAAENDRKGHAN